MNYALLGGALINKLFVLFVTFLRIAPSGFACS